MPELIKPMKPISRSTVIEDNNYIHQIKWDGIRGLVYIEDDTLKLYTNSGRERSKYYPELRDLLALFSGRSCILDGELIVLDDELRPNFNLVLHRDRIKNTSLIDSYAKKYPVMYIIFDILSLDGISLRNKPLSYRQKVLSNHVSANQRIDIVDSYEDGNKLLDLMQEKNFEGIVSKHIDSKYISGKGHNLWYKTKIFKRMLTVVGGLTMKNNRVKSLALGICDSDQNLRYIGNASLGLTAKDISLLTNNVHHLKTVTNNFIDYDGSNKEIWLQPILTCWIGFLEWTDKGHVRHPKLLGFSDKTSNEATGKEYTYYG